MQFMKFCEFVSNVWFAYSGGIICLSKKKIHQSNDYLKIVLTMRLCKRNHTILTMDTKIRQIASIKNNCIVGALGMTRSSWYSFLSFKNYLFKTKRLSCTGDCLDKILESPQYRKCRIIGDNKLGYRHPNGTYSGMFGNFFKIKSFLIIN